MSKPKICLCLTARTVDEDLKLIKKYKKYIDLVELRVDLLDDDERLNIRDFPEKADIPCILTIRRTVDGGKFSEGEASRSMLFARALAFASEDNRKNFAYVDFEEDFKISSLQDAALAYGTKIIRSFHDMKNPLPSIGEKLKTMRVSSFEIPKIAFMPKSLNDVTKMYKEMQGFAYSDQIVVAMGALGLPTRILAERFHSFLSYTSPEDLNLKLQDIGHTDPKTLEEVYHFHEINDKTELFGITGFPLKYTSSPKMHNASFKREKINALYLPFKAEKASEAIEFANTLDIKGFSVTIPHKEDIVKHLFSSEKKSKKSARATPSSTKTGFGLATTPTARASQRRFLNSLNSKIFVENGFQSLVRAVRQKQSPMPCAKWEEKPAFSTARSQKQKLLPTNTNSLMRRSKWNQSTRSENILTS